MHSEAPEHWTLLSLASEPGQTVRCRYFETLPEASHNATVAAQAALSMIVAEAQLPARTNRHRQTDGFSCGLWILQYAEREAREFLNLSQGPFESSVERQSAKLVLWQAALAKEQNKAKAVSQLDSAPPPLPPPPEAPPQAEAAEAVPDVQARSRTFGCGKCRMAVSGCKDCNPAKALRWATKGSKAESEAKAKPGAKRMREVKGRNELITEEACRWQPAVFRASTTAARTARHVACIQAKQKAKPKPRRRKETSEVDSEGWLQLAIFIASASRTARHVGLI